jgi:hypothetical protein
VWLLYQSDFSRNAEPTPKILGNLENQRQHNLIGWCFADD